MYRPLFALLIALVVVSQSAGCTAPPVAPSTVQPSEALPIDGTWKLGATLYRFDRGRVIEVARNSVIWQDLRQTSPLRYMANRGNDTVIYRVLDDQTIEAKAGIFKGNLARVRLENPEWFAKQLHERRIIPADPPASGATGSEPSQPDAPEQPQQRASGRTFVLIVGIDDYSNHELTDLRFAEADARAVYRFYAQDPASPTESDRVKVLLGRDASQREVLRAIDDHLVRKATRPDDTAVFFFAGHGLKDAKGTYLACYDSEPNGLLYTAISVDQLQNLWQEIGAKQRIVITDACHSGGLKNLRGFGGVGKRVVQQSEGSTTLVIAAAGANQLSTEDARAGQGVFTGALLQGLRGGADADRDGTVRAGELQRFLQEEVSSRARELGGKQDPAIESSDPQLLLSTPPR